MASECTGDDDLRREVDSLLAFHDETQDLSLPSAVLPTPTQIGHFRVLRELGRGGMGVVLLAQRGDEPPIALKLLRPDIVSPELLSRFQREATVLARLDHPGIAHLLETGVANTPQGARPWLAIRYIEGVSLREWARSEHPLPVKLELLASIADAVEHAHSHGVVHRDLKPENILVRADGSPVVLDFGVARMADSDVRATTVMTSLGVLVGTIRYMSPEQAEAQLGAIGPRSDVYTLGVVACELLEGRLPYEVPEESVHRALVAVMTARMRPLAQVPPAFRGPLEQLLRAALAKQPELRLPSAAAFAEDLRRVAQGRRPQARVTHDGPLERSRLVRLLPALISVGGIAALLAIAFRQPPTPFDWAEGLVRPTRMFRRVMEDCDSATVRIHYNTRTLPRLREAQAFLESGLALVRTLRWQPYHGEVQQHLRFRLGEARYLIAERTYDAAGYEAAAELWLSARELPQPPPRFPTPDTIGISINDVLSPMKTQPWAAAAMALDDLARLDRSDGALARALAIRREGAAVFARGLGATSLLEVREPLQAAERSALAGWLQGLGSSIVMEGASRSDAVAVREGLGYVRRATLTADTQTESSALASRLHDLGAAFLIAGFFEQADSLLDSATVRLRTAREIRMELPGYTSFVQSSRELARALRLRAWRSHDPRVQRSLLLEALSQLSLPPQSEVNLNALDEAFVGLSAGEVLVDLGCVERDSSRFTEALVRLDRASRLLPPSKATTLASRASLQRVRIEGQRYAITGSRAHLVRANQLIDQGSVIQRQSSPQRWMMLVSEAKQAFLQQRARPYALDYPVATPF